MGGYRYGFNGKENDNEVKGEGNQQDYGMRMYDPRIGKFLSVDPITKKYPELTPYQFASNTPIQAIDLYGLESAGWELSSVKSKLFLQVNNEILIESYQMNTWNKSLQQMFIPSESCQSCNEERTRAINHSIRLNTLRTIMGPVGGGGPNYGQGAVNDPIFKGIATGILAGPLAFPSGTASLTALVATNTLRSGIGGVVADGAVQSTFQLINTGEIRLDRFNYTSMSANLVFSNPLLTAAIGSAAEYTQESGFSNSLLGNKTISRWGFETFVGGSLNVAAGKGANALTPHFGEVGGNATSFFFGTSLGNMLINLNDQKKANDALKEDK
ncbi:hypothetical protein DVR12_26895 [Chitinophaga silvatica]|uniref:RHS repeat-associated core domain-containing protein n=1 Tax=Chitinophaga silvatica TaxID=2282649 RepID=A0A3E1Y225_9BACT|nr:RHS repeat-associated core domain-containing protein [Chitinophaga silvatica]RFS18676.1 hypothetical protein DVR12_26895 [Chitinophaga silvatica]